METSYTQLFSDMNGRHLGWMEVTHENGEFYDEETITDYQFDHCPSCLKPTPRGGFSGKIELRHGDITDPIFECCYCGDEIRSTAPIGNVQNFVLEPRG